MKVRINYNLQCEVDQKKSDCKREPAHYIYLTISPFQSIIPPNSTKLA